MMDSRLLQHRWFFGLVRLADTSPLRQSVFWNLSVSVPEPGNLGLVIIGVMLSTRFRYQKIVSTLPRRIWFPRPRTPLRSMIDECREVIGQNRGQKCVGTSKLRQDEFVFIRVAVVANLFCFGDGFQPGAQVAGNEIWGCCCTTNGVGIDVSRKIQA